MDFAFTPEQEELRRQARSFLAANPEPAWEQLVELGWVGVSIPEEHGGLGLGFLEEAVLLEETARALMPGPWFATTVLAQPLLDAEQARARRRGRGALVGRGGRARAEPRRGGLRRDRGRARGRDGRGRPDDGRDAAARAARRRQRARRPAAGSTPRARSRPSASAPARSSSASSTRGSRQQFGRPVGVFQAVSHALATTFVELETARSVAYWAAWCVAESDPQAPVAAAAAKAKATEAAVAACERSIQVHGGIGFTWEHVLHRLYKRAQWLERFGGGPAELRALVAAAILDDVSEEKERDGLQSIVA